MINRTMMALVLCLLSTQIGARSSDSKDLSLKQRLHHGENLMNVRVPTDADREKVHAIIKERKPDMLYLDAHHHPCTEWDISRICKAAQELNVPVMMRIDHADQAGMISSMLDLGLFSIKVPTVEDEETVQKIIDGFYYPPLGKRSLGASAITSGGMRMPFWAAKSRPSRVSCWHAILPSPALTSSILAART
jgi:2-keto-3-deoxy-L-rhamnonate aldolase RhmA